MTTVIATIFVLGVLIFIHELGHFLFAKWAGIRVEKFSLGFPPTLISRKYGDTVYALGIIPLGGYVKMAGDNPNEETAGEPWEFMSQPIWKRFMVIFAGPFLNFVLAVVVLTGIYTFRGKEPDSMYVGNVRPDSPAAQAGIQTGDYILAIDKYDIRNFDQMAGLVYQKIEQPVVVRWRRGNEIHRDTLVTYRDTLVGLKGDTVEIGNIGIGELVMIGGIEPGLPAEQAGMKPGDIITAVNDIPIQSFMHMASIIYAQPRQPVKVTWNHKGELLEKTITTVIDTAYYETGDTVVIGIIGVAQRSPYERLNIFQAIYAGMEQLFYYIFKVFEFVWGLISREIAPTEIGGPIFIGKIAGETARAGIDVLLEFLALLSINLGVLNLLPIPIFDGSHLVFLIWEKLKGAPPSIKARTAIQQVGLVFIFVMVIYVTFNDITR